MRTSVLQLFIALGITCICACTPNRGCTELTADNYDLNAEEDDGTCIPSRDKLIGDYTYTNLFTDVVSGLDMIQFGVIQVTEANTADNEFNVNFDGSLFLQGGVSQENLTFENHVLGTATYTGSGTWVKPDTVDLVLNITFNDITLPTPQPFVFYCSKTL